MKLTNEMRTDFVDDVMRATKMKSKWDKDKMLAEINKRLLAAAPDEVREFHAKWPGTLELRSFSVDFMYHREKSDKHSYGVYCYANAFKDISLNNIFCDDLKSEWEKYRAEVEARKEMKARLMQIAKEMTTDDQLLAALPKLAKYVPKPVVKVKACLPVALKGIQDELAQMGLEAAK